MADVVPTSAALAEHAATSSFHKRRKKSSGAPRLATGVCCDGSSHVVDVSDDGWVTLDPVLGIADVAVISGFAALQELHLGGGIDCGPETCD